MKMYPDDWRFRLTTGVVTVACLATTLMLGPRVGIHGFWPGMIAVVVAIIVGNLLGGVVYRRLSRPPSSGPPEKEKKDEKK